MKETIKDTYIIMKGKEIIKCKNLFTNLRVYKSQTNTYIILVIETNGENHKENDECKLSFTKNRVYKNQTIKYIILVKTKTKGK